MSQVNSLFIRGTGAKGSYFTFLEQFQEGRLLEKKLFHFRKSKPNTYTCGTIAWITNVQTLSKTPFAGTDTVDFLSKKKAGPL